MNPIVISLGGSLLSEPNYAKKFARILLPLSGRFRFAVVVGGGEKAKCYADAARRKTKSEFYADEAAIKATRENAALVKNAFGKKVGGRVITHPLQAADALKRHASRLVFSGGFLPGITTDACSVLVAEAVGAKKIINASCVDGVYDRNPSLRGAKKFKRLTHEQLVGLAARFDQRRARTNFIFDLVAAKLAARSCIRVEFVDGRDLKQLKNAIEGKKHEGTVVF